MQQQCPDERAGLNISKGASLTLRMNALKSAAAKKRMGLLWVPLRGFALSAHRCGGQGIQGVR